MQRNKHAVGQLVISFEAIKRLETRKAIEVEKSARSVHAEIMAKIGHENQRQMPEISGRSRDKGGNITHYKTRRAYFIKRDEPRLFEGAPLPPDFIGRGGNKNRVEIQANQFASYLLMPLALILPAWEAWHGSRDPIALDQLDAHQRQELLVESHRRGRGRSGQMSDEELMLEELSRPLAERFGVSAEAMRYRLVGMGLLVRKKEASLFD